MTLLDLAARMSARRAPGGPMTGPATPLSQVPAPRRTPATIA
ncbi:MULTISPECIES: hypothetical protein [Frankia]|nr:MULTISPECIES: hypothetical protein [Frankia]